MPPIIVLAAGAFTAGAIVHRLIKEVRRINAELVKAVAAPEVQERMAGAGLEPFPSSPEDFAAFVKRDLQRWAKVIKDAGIQPE